MSQRSSLAVLAFLGLTALGGCGPTPPVGINAANAVGRLVEVNRVAAAGAMVAGAGVLQATVGCRLQGCAYDTMCNPKTGLCEPTEAALRRQAAQSGVSKARPPSTLEQAVLDQAAAWYERGNLKDWRQRWTTEGHLSVERKDGRASATRSLDLEAQEALYRQLLEEGRAGPGHRLSQEPGKLEVLGERAHLTVVARYAGRGELWVTEERYTLQREGAAWLITEEELVHRSRQAAGPPENLEALQLKSLDARIAGTPREKRLALSRALRLPEALTSALEVAASPEATACDNEWTRALAARVGESVRPRRSSATALDRTCLPAGALPLP